MIKRLIFISLVLFFIIFGFSCNLLGAEQQYQIENYYIEMDLNKDGDFIITEEIEYNFLEGEFSTAYREIPGRGFSRLDFNSITGSGTPVTDYNVDDGSSLEIDWEYPSTTDSATFKIEYTGRSGLISSDGRNIVDWQVIGTDWEVPIENAEVRVNLLEAAEDIEFTEGGESANISSRNLHFQKEDIEAGAGWNLSFNFKEQIEMPEKTTISDYFYWLLGIIIIALFLVIYRIIKGYNIMKTAGNRLKLNEEQILQFNDLSFPEKIILHDYSAAKGARMLAALIFHFTKMNLIKFKIEVKDKFFGGEKTEIKLSLADDQPNNKQQSKNLEIYRPLFDEITEDKKLEKVISKTSLWKEIINNFKKENNFKRWESDYRKDIKNRSLFLSILLTVCCIGTFLDFAISNRVITFLPSVFFGILAGGEFIRYFIIVPLNDTAIKMREKIDAQIVEKRERLEELVETEPLTALELILNNLSWFLADQKMSGSKFKKIREKIEKNISKEEAETLELPDWLAVEGLEGALKTIEVVEYTMTAVYAAVASTGAAAGGAAGGGAGGGGGGAG